MDLAINRKASYNYEILEKLEAGLCLAGMEVKSIKQRQLDLKDAYAIIKNNEAWLLNMYVKPYKFDGRQEVSATRTRKLLLTSQEIKKLIGKIKQKGFVLIPLKVYLSSKNLVKVTLGLGKAKKIIDKKEDKKQKDIKRDLEKKFGKIS